MSDTDGVPFAEKIKSVQVRPGGPGRTREQVTEGRTKDGGRFKITTDEHGHDVTEETTASGEERRHVRINLG